MSSYYICIQERVQYLLDKRFPPYDIPDMIKRVPTIINVSVKDLDANLGYIQKEFKLNGEHTYIHTRTRYTEIVQTLR